MALAALALCGAAAPPPNASLCAVESCMAMPTGCHLRPECAGCGALCFNPNTPSPAYDLFLNTTGLGEQASGTQCFPRLPLRPGAPRPPCPWPTAARCLRGENTTLRKWKATDAPSASPAACCAACAATERCIGWQLITQRAGGGRECWAMATAAAKPWSADSCVSGVVAGEPVPEVRTADVVLTWSSVEPAPGNFSWAQLDAAEENARQAGGRLILLLWTGQDAPAWLYRPPFSVPRLARSADGASAVPDYRSATYQRRLHAVHSALAARMRGSADRRPTAPRGRRMWPSWWRTCASRRCTSRRRCTVGSAPWLLRPPALLTAPQSTACASAASPSSSC